MTATQASADTPPAVNTLRVFSRAKGSSTRGSSETSLHANEPTATKMINAVVAVIGRSSVSLVKHRGWRRIA